MAARNHRGPGVQAPRPVGICRSVATADRLVRTIVSLAEVQLADAVKMMTLTPARIMKVDDCKGSLAVGKDADIVIFDEGINVKTTIIGGKCLTIH